MLGRKHEVNNGVTGEKKQHLSLDHQKMCLSQRRERLECFSSSNETWQTLKASQCDAGGAQSAVTAASPCQSDCVEVLGELWGIWEAAIKPELCHRRGGVINCGDYYREFLGVYNSCGFLEEEEVKRSHLTRGGNIFQSYISTWKRVCVCSWMYNDVSLHVRVAACWCRLWLPSCERREQRSESFMNLHMMNFVLKAALTYRTYSSALVCAGSGAHMESKSSPCMRLRLK